MELVKTYEQLVRENEDLLWRLEEATETIEAIRTGQVDALVVQGDDGKQKLYTLKTADQTYRVLIEKMNQGAITLNEQGVILYCNSKFASIVDVPLYKVIGKPFAVFIPKDFRDAFRDLFEEGWKEDAEDADVEILIQGRDRVIACQVSVTTLELDGGTCLSIIVTDLSYQKEIQALLRRKNIELINSNTELAKSNRDLQLFASVASHDLQEPLRKIQIFGTLLRDKFSVVLPEEGGRYLDKIVTSSNRMKTMIADILAYARLANDEKQFVRTPLKDVVDEVIDDYELVISEKSAQLFIDELPAIEVNRGEIRQVFQNLISNALKFSKDNVRPVISIANENYPEDWNMPEGNGNYCCIGVSDNGIGFDEGFGNKIFSLFQRLNTKDKYEGSGIGLAITKKIIDKHNGQIWAKSTEGTGSKFIMVLPLVQKKIEIYG